MIDPMTMGAVHPRELEPNLDALRRILSDRIEHVTEPESVAVANVLLVMIKGVRSSPTESAYRGGYRSLYIIARDGMHSSVVTSERRRLYVSALNILEGMDA